MPRADSAAGRASRTCGVTDDHRAIVPPHISRVECLRANVPAEYYPRRGYSGYYGEQRWGDYYSNGVFDYR
jgi:hypothetical protein